MQVVDKTGQIRSIVVWQCGPDMLYADSLDGLFDNTRRRKAPEWLTEQIRALPLEKQFTFDGSPKGGSKSSVPEHIPASDTDAPDFVQG